MSPSGASSVIGHAKLSCSWDIPEPPVGQNLDPSKVNVRLTDANGGEHFIGHVTSAADCSKVEHGWYYDDPSQPQTVLVCPQTCSWIQGLATAELDVLFGCATEDATPV